MVAQRDLRDLPDPDPRAELASFTVLDGFEVNLFAAEPMLVDPIHMNFDSRGRLWVAASPIYPQIEPGAKPADKVYVLEDTDGDGVADKSTIFADDLLIPTAVLPDPSCNGAYVGNSTELLHLSDTDGDGKADQRRIVLSGFGTEDTHHILHTLRYGPDGAIYFNQSIYIHSHIETPWGVKRLNGSGTWRFRPESMKLEIFMRGLVNPWGHIFTPWGTSFATDGAGGEGINYVFPGAAFVSAVDAPRILRGLNPGQPKHCGLEIASGRHLPEDWNGTLITNDFRGNRVNRFALEEEGSGFISRQLPDLITSSHIAFRPIDVKMGPDGAVYIADWYNPIIQHGEVDFRDPRRDHGRGRIWRITAKNRPLVEKPDVMNASVDQLLEMLKAPEGWTRDHARLQLQQMPYDLLVEALQKWLSRLDKNHKDYDLHRLEALRVMQPWSMQALQAGIDLRLKVSAPFHELVSRMFTSGVCTLGPPTADPDALAAALRLMPEWGESLEIPPSTGHVTTRGTIQWAARQNHARLRLEAVVAARAMGNVDVFEDVMAVLDKPMDGNLDYALWLTARELAPQWLPEFQAGRLTFGGNVSHIAFALRAVENPAALAPLVKLLQEGKIEPKDEPATIALIGELGDSTALAVVLDLALHTKDTVALDALVKAAQQRKARPAGDLSRIVQLLDRDNPEPVQAAAARLAGMWQVSTSHPWLLAIAEGADSSDALRAAAVEGLAAFGPGGRQTLVELTDAQQPPTVRAAALAGLASVDVNTAAAIAAVVLPGIEREADAALIFEAFLRSEQGPAALAKALDGKTIPGPVAALGLRKAASSGRGPAAEPLNAALASAGSLAQMTQQLTTQEMARLLIEVGDDGDPHRGEAVYRRATLQCAVCHAIAGGGGKVGPDLVSLGASAPVDYIVESLLEPAKKIKEGYHMTVITTKDGKVVAGGLVKETDRELVIRDAADNAVTVPLANVQNKQIVPTSLMPPGLTASLRRDEFVDLVRFLSELGKDGDFKAPPGRLVRSWLILEGTPRIGRRMAETSTALITTDDRALDWKAGYSLVSGELPLSDLPVSRRWESDFGAVRFAIEVTTPGKIGLHLGDPTGLQMWRGTELVDVAPLTVVDLPKGVHTFNVAINTTQRTAPLRIELVDVEASPGRAQPVAPF